MNTQETIELYNKCVIGNYPRLPIVITRAEGSQMWDADGKRYLDLFPGWGCSLLGHCHPRVIEAIQQQASRLAHIDNIFHSEPQGRLAELLHRHGFGGKSFFCNSGAEANEAAIKLARRATPPERYKIITMEKGFHGRTYAAMTATAQSKAHVGYEPLVPGFVYVPFNDIDAVRKAMTKETAAVLVEPIQGEGGVNIPDESYLPALRDLCSENGVLLILDEVQTGCGRTGRWFAHQHYGIEPDIMTLAKALGNGVPIGAMVAQPEVSEAFKPGSHASTYGGNAIVVAAAIAVLETIEQERLLERVGTLATTIESKLESLAERFSLISSIRVHGLMVAIQLSVPGRPLADAALERGLRINCTQGDVLRMLPAMTLSIEELDEAIEMLSAVLEETESQLVAT